MNLTVFRDTWRAFNEDKAPRLAASIAYATLFSLAPLFIVLIAVAGSLLGASGQHSNVEDALVEQVRRGAGDDAAQAIRQMVAASFDKPRQGAIAQTIGWITFVLGASGLFGALQDALNSVWRVEETRGGWRHMIRERVASFGMVAAVGFLLLVSFAANAVATVVSARFASLVPFAGGSLVLNVASFAVSFAIVTVVFALVYKVLPDVRLAWRDIWPGAMVTAALFLVGQALIALYIAVAGLASAYGAAGSLLVTLAWIYYSALVLLLGAEFTKVRAGPAHTTVAATIRETVERPAGVDPRRRPAAP